MNARTFLRAVFLLAAATATPVCPAIVQTAISALQEKAEKEVDRVIEKQSDKLRQQLVKATDKATDAIRDVAASVDDVREDIEEVRKRVTAVKETLQKAKDIITAAEEVPKYIQALMNNEDGGYATYVNTVIANSGAYVQSAAQTAAHVNSGLNDLLKKLEEAKEAAVMNKIGHANTTPFDPDEADDEKQMTEEEKKSHVEVVAEDDGLTEADLEKKRKEEEAELQKEQDEADAARKKEDGTVDMSAWTRTREDGTVTTKTRLEEQKEEEEAGKSSGEEDVSGSGDSFDDGEEVPQWVLDQASKE